MPSLALREAAKDNDDDDDDIATSVATDGVSRGRTVLTAFVVIFIAEWGDLTQILTANLAVRYHSPVSVGVGALAALWLVAAIAVGGGQGLLRTRACRDPFLSERHRGRAVRAVGVLGLAGGEVAPAPWQRDRDPERFSPWPKDRGLGGHSSPPRPVRSIDSVRGHPQEDDPSAARARMATPHIGERLM